MKKYKKHQTVFLIMPVNNYGMITGVVYYIRGKVVAVHRKEKDYYTVRTKNKEIKCWVGGICEFPHELMYSYTVL